MGVEEVHTEELIKEKAKYLFFQRGLLNATTQEIADEAGVNRALIHYYFRSRDQLLETLLDETLMEKKERVRNILSSRLPFREKIALYINTIVNYGITYPYLDNFIINETARNTEKVREFCLRDRQKSADLIREDLAAEIKAGRLAPITPVHFMVNLSAMCNYPLLAKPVIQAIHCMSEAAYKKFLLDRKQVIFMTVFNEPMPHIDDENFNTNP
ncbi:MAG: TetR/AcrR family transcriptional regulator [Bacteroidia bacterium]|nr:TetR/AcrR family transcriptional regulator [Bacteroidia bacterium]